MTRDEAINILNGYYSADDVRQMDALDMAIEALRAQNADTNVGDMISKKAVLRVLTDIAYNSCKTEGQAQLIDWVKTIVCVMPSAQQEIIRCRDCTYGAKDEDGYWFCRGIECQIGDHEGNGFCSDAERRTDGSD